MKQLFLLFILLSSPFCVFALTSTDAVITTMIIEREPVDKVDIYPAQSGQLYCFTLIEGATTDTSVDHVWIYQGKEMARVSLPVRSAKWRTYSSKRIVPEWKGDWEVRVIDSTGQELTTTYFRVE